MLTLSQWLKQTNLPRLEARLLLQHVTQLSHAQIITHDNQQLNNQQLNTLNQLQQRRQQGEPIAYLLGYKEFFGRTFQVSPCVLIPRPETEHLVETTITYTPKNANVLDLGTGSGIIAITLKLERPDLTVYASDISVASLAVAQHNAQQLKANINFFQGDWFKAIQHRLPENSFHTIVSNPPYIEHTDPHLSQGDLRFEPTQALTDFADGYQHIQTIIQQAPKWLIANGWLMLEHGYQQGKHTRAIFQSVNFKHITTLPDLAQLDRISIGQFIPHL